MSTPLRPAERAYSLSTRAGWEEFVTAPPRPRPDLLTRAQVRALPEAARAEYEERRSVWHANIGPLRTPQMRAVHEQLDDIVEANRQDGDKVRAHPLAIFGGPSAFSPDVWSVFAHPGAEQRIRRLLALPGQPGLHHAARQVGIRTAILTSQIRRLEAAVGTALLRTRPDGQLTLTAYGELFARDVRPVLESLTQSRSQRTIDVS